MNLTVIVVETVGALQLHAAVDDPVLDVSSSPNPSNAIGFAATDVDRVRQSPRNPALFNYPSYQVSHYVQRPELLQAIDDGLAQSGDEPRETAIAVLLGMGGCGKTQLALTYCRQADASGVFGAIFWLDASNLLTLNQSVGSVAEGVFGHKPEFASAAVMVASIKRVMASWDFRWLLVMDNFDRPHEFEAVNLRDYWPSHGKGAVLFTSRHEATTRLAQPLNVSGMTDDEGVDLLVRQSRCIPSEENLVAAWQIAQSLGNLPLAIDQAGAYIAARHLSLQDFPRHLQKRKEKVLKETPPLQWEYPKSHGDLKLQTSLSVFTTYELSLECLTGDEEDKKAKLHFLTLSAFLDPNNILEDIFHAHYDFPGPRAAWLDLFTWAQSWDEDAFHDVLAEFKNLSVLQSLERGTEGSCFSFHPLISEWIKLRQDPKGRHRYAVEATIVFSHLFPTTDEQGDINFSYAKRQRVLLHLDACTKNCQEYLRSSECLGKGELAQPARRFAHYYTEQGLFKDAERMYDAVIENDASEFGPDSRASASILYLVAWNYRYQARWDESIAMAERALRCAEKHVDAHDPDSLKALNCIGVMYGTDGRFAHAEGYLCRGHALSEPALGPSSLITIGFLANLAVLHLDSWQSIKAEDYASRAVEAYKASVGQESQQYFRALQIMGRIQMQLRRPAEAEAALLESHGGLANTLGPTHPDTLDATRNLAALYHRSNGELDKALDMLHSVFETQKNVLGLESLITLDSQTEIASLLASLGRTEEAEAVFSENLAKVADVVGRTDRRCLDGVLYQMAVFYDQIGQREKGDALFEEILNMTRQERSEQPKSAEVRILWRMYLVRARQGRTAEAQAFLEEGFLTVKKLVGDDLRSPTYIGSLRYMARSYENLDRLDLADQMASEMLAWWQDGSDPSDALLRPDDESILQAARLALPNAFSSVCNAIVSGCRDWMEAEMLFNLIAIAMIAVGDTSSAQIALEQLLERDGHGRRLTSDWFECESCSPPAPIIGTIYQCSEDFLHRVCHQCYMRTSMPERCRNSAHFKVPSDGWLSLPAGTVDDQGNTLTQWLGRLRERYSWRRFPSAIEAMLARQEVDLA